LDEETVLEGGRKGTERVIIQIFFSIFFILKLNNKLDLTYYIFIHNSKGYKMELQPLDYLNGPLSVIVVVISFYVGIQILMRYVQTKNKLFLYVGIVAICTSEPWWPHVISLILVLTTGSALLPEVYFIIGNIFIPVAIYLWLMAFAEFMIDSKKKLVMVLGAIYVALYEILFFTLLFLDDEAFIGVIIPAIDVQYNPIMIGFLLTALLIILPTGVLFGRESFKSGNPEIRMKGKFLILAFFSFCIGASVDVLILSNPINLTIARVLLVVAAFGFLGGFIPPDWIRKMFIKEKEVIEKKVEEESVDLSQGSVESKLAEKMEKKTIPPEYFDQIEKALLESSRIRLDVLKSLLQLDDAVFGDMIFDWSTEYGLKIEGDYLNVEREKASDFFSRLQRHFE